jgi:hypothetical protein
MKYDVALRTAAGLLTDRGERYGAPDECFTRIANLASVFFNRQVTEYEVAMMMHFVKLGRAMETRDYVDNYVDGINYLAFATQFSGASKTDPVSVPDEVGIRGAAMPSTISQFAPKRSPKVASAISEDALRQAMDAVSAELDIVEK